MSNLILEIKDLCIRNKNSGEIILDHISFSVEKQKITGIVGESGSGKSITALSIMGLLPPSLALCHGQILFHFNHQSPDLTTLPYEKMNALRGKEISMIFQEPMSSLNPSMKCGDQVMEPLLFHTRLTKHDARIKVMELFQLTGLPEPERIFSSYPHQLSGGQRQRIMIAMALSTNPSLIIADEPTTALDVTVQKSIIELLRQLQKDLSLSVIFISHDLRLLGEIADAIVVMRSGRIIEKNSKIKIFSEPRQTYTKGLLACQPPAGSKPERLITIKELEDGILPTENQVPSSNKKRKENAPENKILQINDLSVIYRRSQGAKKHFTALHELTLTLYRGETLGLVGESGCGKTTLGKTILLLIDSNSGNIIYKGKNIREMNRQDSRIFRKNVQVVFQDPYSSLNPRMKTGTVLEEARHLHFPDEKPALRRNKIANLLTRAGMHPKDLEKYPHQFSGGQRQRIGIVRALVTEPELIVLDESVSALDVSVQAQILNLLNDLKKEFNLSYLFISHDLAVVRYMSDRIIIMKDGKFEEEGDPDEVYNHPSSAYTKKLIASIPGSL